MNDNIDLHDKELARKLDMILATSKEKWIKAEEFKKYEMSDGSTFFFDEQGPIVTVKKIKDNKIKVVKNMSGLFFTSTNKKDHKSKTNKRINSFIQKGSV